MSCDILCHFCMSHVEIIHGMLQRHTNPRFPTTTCAGSGKREREMQAINDYEAKAQAKSLEEACDEPK